MESELFLIYINEVGKTWEGQYRYEFLFSDKTSDVDGVDWDVYPAAGNPEPPRADLVKKIGILVSDIKLNLIQNSDTFAVWDAIDNVIALGWEDISEYDEYPDIRMCFRFAEPISSVTNKLYEKDIILDFNNSKNEKHTGKDKVETKRS
jgi:hypothetical protein